MHVTCVGGCGSPVTEFSPEVQLFINCTRPLLFSLTLSSSLLLHILILFLHLPFLLLTCACLHYSSPSLFIFPDISFIPHLSSSSFVLFTFSYRSSLFFLSWPISPFFPSSSYSNCSSRLTSWACIICLHSCHPLLPHSSSS